MFLHKRKAQSTAEYAIVIAVVIGAAIAMQFFVKRGLQGGLKFGIDKVTVRENGTATEQYEPYYQLSDYATERSNVRSKVETKEKGEITRTISSTNAPETTTRTGYQKTLAPQ